MSELNPNHAPSGFRAVAPKTNRACAGCVFETRDAWSGYCANQGRFCSSKNRPDKKNVIFVRAPAPSPRRTSPPPVQLKDTDPVPWGQYGPPPKGTGKLMADVPASYFFYLWTVYNKEHDLVCPVADYIRRNLDLLRAELPDAIWEAKKGY